MIAAKVIQEAKLTEFFQEKIVAAMARNNVTIDNDVEFYLTTLLCDFLRPRSQIPDTPLALLLQEAIESSSRTQLVKFKSLGDLSLYVAGYFQESFNRRVVDVDYYIALGSIAYRQLAAIVSKNAQSTYEKLAQDFPLLVELVAEVAVVPGQDRPVDILATYDRWTRSNSRRLLRILQESGIDPIPVGVKGTNGTAQ